MTNRPLGTFVAPEQPPSVILVIPPFLAANIQHSNAHRSQADIAGLPRNTRFHMVRGSGIREGRAFVTAPPANGSCC